MKQLMAVPHRHRTCLAGVSLWLALSGCHEQKEHASPVQQQQEATGGTENGGEGGNHQAGEECGMDTLRKPLPSPAPWQVEAEGGACEHVPVEPDCKEGWCRIPAGCFVKGSPETEPRHSVRETAVPVTLTRSFLIGETEVTQRAWNALMESNPSGVRATVGQGTAAEETFTSHLGDIYPVDNVSWLEAALFANALSESEGRQSCYVLEGCAGQPGLPKVDYVELTTFQCASVTSTTDSVYDCEGYRLPTSSEWEYAARAGGRTALPTGDTSETPKECDPALELIAWHRGNSSLELHPVGMKLPNAWGLHDIVGNAEEHVSDCYYAVLEAPPAPWVDHVSALSLGQSSGPVEKRISKGGSFGSFGYRLARETSKAWSVKFVGTGFRLVRTLGENETW